jgi:phosphate transport system substrate-binding protein
MALGLQQFGLQQFKIGSVAIALSGSVALVAANFATSIPLVQSQGAPIKIDGSSTVFPISEAVAEAFQKQGKGRVTVGVSGTGGGFKKFCAKGGIDIANASRPISSKEMAACRDAGVKYIEMPIAYDALTVVVNPKNNWATDITPAELKKIWEPDSKVTRWNEVRPNWPNRPIKLFGPGADSGTFDYFTEAINGKSKASRTDYTPSENDNVLVQGVSRDIGAMGYFGYSYYESNRTKVKALTVNGVAPSSLTVENGKYKPLSRPMFIYVSVNSLARPEVKSFAEFYLNNGARFARATKNVALPAKGYTLVRANLDKRKTGTLFAGEEAVGLTIEQLMAREAKQ